MKKTIQLLLIVFPLFYACNTDNQEDTTEKLKKEILETETEFAKMAEREGIEKAFLSYAAEDAVLMRNNNLIIGKKAIEDQFTDSKADKASLTWKPDFIDVSSSGDLGYTYGTYTYTTTDSTGNKQEVKGIFHTVWKKQADGTWKYVWD